MEVTLLDTIFKSIASVGVVNTLIGIGITVVLSYLYRNKQKANKILIENVQTNNENVISAIKDQNQLLFEVERTSNSVLVAIKEVGAKVDGFMNLVVGLVQRDVDRGGE